MLISICYIDKQNLENLIMEEAEIKRILSVNIKHHRSVRGWSQVKLAEKINISTNFLADIETGKSWVSSLTLSKLARIFEIEAYELFIPKNKNTSETKEAVKEFMHDISVNFRHTMSELSKKYLD